MCDTIKELVDLRKVESKNHMILILCYKDYGIFHDDLNDLWYLCRICSNYSPVDIFDGSSKAIESVFYNYVKTGKVEFNVL